MQVVRGIGLTQRLALIHSTCLGNFFECSHVTLTLSSLECMKASEMRQSLFYGVMGVFEGCLSSCKFKVPGYFFKRSFFMDNGWPKSLEK